MKHKAEGFLRGQFVVHGASVPTARAGTDQPWPRPCAKDHPLETLVAAPTAPPE